MKESNQRKKKKERGIDIDIYSLLLRLGCILSLPSPCHGLKHTHPTFAQGHDSIGGLGGRHKA